MGRNPSDLVVFIGVRLLQLIPVLIGVVAITFFFTHILTPDPCAAWNPHSPPPVLAACRAHFALNQPLYIQFERYGASLVFGDLGTSVNGAPVLPQILTYAPATIELVLASLVLMIIIGIPLGVVAAAHAGRAPDHAVRIFYLLGWSFPTYLVALLLVLFVGPALGLPTQGTFSTSSLPFPQVTHMSIVDALLAGNLAFAGDALSHLFLPALALAFLNLGIVTRMTRASMLEVLPADYIKTARVKGLSDRNVLYRHALRNSLISTVTVLGFTVSGLLAGTVVIEAVFHWPGIGQYAYLSVINYDFSGAIGVVIFFALGVVIANLIADILYGILDPRVDWR